MSKSKKPYFPNGCTIIRTWEQRKGSLNMATGEYKPGDTVETITGPCAIPLFSDEERATGICKSCRQGWEVPANKFSSEDEKQRAVGLK